MGDGGRQHTWCLGLGTELQKIPTENCVSGDIITDVERHGSGEYTFCGLGGYGVVDCGGVPRKGTFVGIPGPKWRRYAGPDNCRRKSDASSGISQRDKYHDDTSDWEYARKMVWIGERGWPCLTETVAPKRKQICTIYYKGISTAGSDRWSVKSMSLRPPT